MMSVLLSITAYVEGELTGSLIDGENPDEDSGQVGLLGMNPPQVSAEVKNASGESVTALTPTQAYDIEISQSDADAI